MNKYNFDEKVDRRAFNSCKWDYEEDVISLTIADSDFPTSKEVSKAIEEISKYGRLGYTDVPKEYFESYKEWFSSRYNAKFEVEDCVFSTGVVASIDSILKRIANPGDGVMMFTPTYNVFFNCLKNNGLIVKECPFIYNDGKYEVDYKLFDTLIKEVKIFILCNPHNPNGYRFSKKEIDYISSKCLENNVYLLSDEIHADIDYNKERYNSTLTVTNNPLLITFLSPGKTFNLAGLHSSIVVVKDALLREKIQKGLYTDDLGEPSIYGINPVIAAYKYGSDYVKELNYYLYDNKKYLMDFVKKNIPSFKVVDNETTYLMWIDISKLGISSTKFCSMLLRQNKVAINPGYAYGDDRFVRINIATQLSTLKEALNRIKEFAKTI